MMFRPLQLLFVSNLRYSGRGSGKLEFSSHHCRQFTAVSSKTSTSSVEASSNHNNICIFASEVPVIANLNRYRNMEDVSINLCYICSLVHKI